MAATNRPSAADDTRAEAVEAIKAHLTDRYVDLDAEDLAWTILNNLNQRGWTPGRTETTTSTDEACGDYPAPCNCDDPETHDAATTGAFARAEARTAGDPDRMDVTRRPRRAETATWCNCQAIPSSTNYPGPWHERGGEAHYPCAKTPPAPAGDAARVIANYLAAYTLPANYSRPISGETHRAVAEHVAPLIARELDRHRLLATAPTDTTKEN